MQDPKSAVRQRSGRALLKVAYLLAVTAAAFAVPALAATGPAPWYVLPGLLALQAALLMLCRVGPGEILRGVGRLKWLIVFLAVCYGLLPGENGAPEAVYYPWAVPGTGWTISLNLTGLRHAGLMSLQVLTVVLASAVVRLTGPGTDLVDGLRALGLPDLFVHSLDQTLALLGGPRRPRPVGDARPGPGPVRPGHPAGLLALLNRLRRGDTGFLLQSLRGSFSRARERVARDCGGRLDARLGHDVAVVTGTGLLMASLKMLKVLPGIPVAPGIKTLLLFPLYVLASQATRSRWGGTAAGAVMGVVGFLQGDGRFGVLEVFKHLTPGLVIDLARPVLAWLPRSAWVYCLLGFVAAVGRTSTELLVVWLLGARAEVYLFPAVKLVPNLLAGTLSGLVTAAVLPNFLQEEVSQPDGPASPGGGPGAKAPGTIPAGRPESHD
jgi:hypothetical protein